MNTFKKPFTFVVFIVSIFSLFILLFINSNNIASAETEPVNKNLLNCLCKAGCTEANWNCSVVSCYYHPEASSASPDCSNTSKGECICQGFGCGRAKMPTSGDAYDACYEQYDYPKDGDNKCETKKGESCHQNPGDCKCETGTICDPANKNSNDKGCVDFENACPANAHISLITGRCACNDASQFMTKDGCVSSCPPESKFSNGADKCVCSRVGYTEVNGKCVPEGECPMNSNRINGVCTCIQGYKQDMDGTNCVRDITDSAKLKIIIDGYMTGIPKGLVDSGQTNNFYSIFNSKYEDYACGGYQAKVLKYLDGLKFSEDPEKRALLDNFDYGPVQAYFGGHQVVALYPKGTDWTITALILDPWPNQKPEVFDIATWSLRFSAGSYYGISGSIAYSDEGNMNYPTVGGTYKNPAKKIASDEQTLEVFASLTDSQKQKLKSMSLEQRNEFIKRRLLAKKIKVITNSPVIAYAENAQGLKLGDKSVTEAYEDMKDIAIATKYKLEDGNYSTAFNLPEDAYEIKLTGTGDGPVNVVIALENSKAINTVFQANFDIENMQVALIWIDPLDMSVTGQLDNEVLAFSKVNSEKEINIKPLEQMDVIENAEAWSMENWGSYINKKCDQGEELLNGICVQIDSKDSSDQVSTGNLILITVVCCLCFLGIGILFVITIVLIRKRKSTKPDKI